MKIAHIDADMLWITPNPEQAIERAGRTCYKSEDKITPTSAAEFVRRMVDSGHHAMIEHACASMHFVCDRGVTHELVRHRLVSYAQESTRYCNYGKDKFGIYGLTFIQPPDLKEPYCDGTQSETDIWRAACMDAEYNYLKLIREGVKPQIARSVLPISLKTEIVATCNLRQWRLMFSLRTSSKAHPQIRKMMLIAGRILKAQAPNVFYDFDFEVEV